MKRSAHKGAEEARTQLPALLSDAERGRSTIITRRGRAIAAIVPIGEAGSLRQRSLLPLVGSGQGMWSADGPASIARQRDEWN